MNEYLTYLWIVLSFVGVAISGWITIGFLVMLFDARSRMQWWEWTLMIVFGPVAFVLLLPLLIMMIE